MSAADSVPDLGAAVERYRRTIWQNIGVLLMVAALWLPTIGVVVVMPTSTVLATIAALTASVVTLMILWQILPNLNVCWTLFERGFVRTRLGRTDRFPYEEVAALHVLPGREARIELRNGRALTVAGLKASNAVARALDLAIADERFALCQSNLAEGETVVLGPQRISEGYIQVGDLVFERWRADDP